MHIQLIQVPYDSGHRDVRMGHGPQYFVQHGAVETLRRHDRTVDLESIEAQRPFHAEIYTAFELDRQLAQRVRAAKESRAFPLVLSGNCNSSLGTLGGVNARSAGIIWFDAHGDFNTPETTKGGFLDGMALAIATGRCWTRMAQSIPGFAALPDERVLMIGMRQIDDGEQALLERSQVTLIRGEQIRTSGLRENLEQALTRLHTHVQQVYLHIDLDVLDIQVGQANSYAEPNGLFVNEMEQAISMIAQQFEIAAAAFTAYDPSCDPEGNILRAGLRLMEHVVGEIEANIQKA
jgi:arginase